MADWKNRIVGYDVVDADQILANESNWRGHPKFQQDSLTGILDDIGWVQEVIINKRTSEEWGKNDRYVETLVDGHLRVMLAISRGEKVPVKYVDLTPREEKLILATYDPISALAFTDKEQFDALLREVNSDSAAVQQMLAELAASAGLDYGALDTTPITDTQALSLEDRFIVPPFSVLDARQGYWQARKRQWLALGLQSELGRGENALHQTDEARNEGLNHYRIQGKLPADSGGQPLPLDRMSNGKTPARKFAQDLMRGEHVMGNSRREADQRSNINNAPPLPLWATGTGTANMASGTSIFDPVLCELAYRWFCPPDGLTLDPFAGGSVRGIVAAKLGRRYIGVDLRPEQVAANEMQAVAITPESLPRWVVGDSRNLDSLVSETVDFIFSCPPYFDLEIYSDDTQDLSNTGDYAAFITAYRAIIASAVSKLNNHRFACFVVGDIRDKQGMYRNFVSDTIAAFQDAGALLYNEGILVTSVGSLPIRVRKQFESGRKLGKTHQNVLVFIKGDPRKATEAVGKVEAYWPDDEPNPASE